MLSCAHASPDKAKLALPFPLGSQQQACQPLQAAFASRHGTSCTLGFMHAHIQTHAHRHVQIAHKHARAYYVQHTHTHTRTKGMREVCVTLNGSFFLLINNSSACIWLLLPFATGRLMMMASTVNPGRGYLDASARGGTGFP